MDRLLTERCNPVCSSLVSAAECIQANNHDVAQVAIANLLHTESEDLQAHIFAGALAKRLGQQGSNSNLYLQECDSDAQIDLFAVMSEGFPLVWLAKDIANRMIIDHWRQLPSVVLVDIGIGTGSQEVELLRVAATEGGLPSRLTIVGVEPADGSLARARRSIEDVAREIGVDVEFVAIPRSAEAMTESDWNWISSLPGEKIVAGSFAFHHVVSTDERMDAKSELLHRLRALEPKALILIEPDSDHHTSCLPSRLRNAWNHYGLAFRVIDTSALNEETKKILKRRFFGREVEDILSNAEDLRTERHESAEMWVGRLIDAGFHPKAPPTCRNSPVPSVSVMRCATHVALGYEGSPIVAVIEASCA